MTDEVARLVDDILAYELGCKADLFEGAYDRRSVELLNDVERLTESQEGEVVNLDDLVYDAPRTVAFYHDDEQENIIERHVNLYGRDDMGVTRILSKVYLQKLFRKAEFDGTISSKQGREEHFRTSF